MTNWRPKRTVKRGELAPNGRHSFRLCLRSLEAGAPPDRSFVHRERKEAKSIISRPAPLDRVVHIGDGIICPTLSAPALRCPWPFCRRPYASSAINCKCAHTFPHPDLAAA
ncbi:hypothetical protein NMY22_g776 [Coprinellus aureogranulatus]|nr:hypothetical protein NMY22_g776 [Coprinellus aureogranulatus]